MKARQSLVRVTAGRYQKASKKEKGKILDEFVQSTGYQRCYASSLLSRQSPPPLHQLRRLCNTEVRQSKRRLQIENASSKQAAEKVDDTRVLKWNPTNVRWWDYRPSLDEALVGFFSGLLHFLS